MAASDPDCPRCGSAEVVPALAGGPSEQVLQLRSGNAPGAPRGSFDEWLCGSCGNRWPHPRLAIEVPLVVDEFELDRGTTPSNLTGDLVELLGPPHGEGSAGDASPRVARALREAREARGVTISDASKVTRISERYLQALEDDASLDEFPAPAYAQFFLRNYAEFLGLEPKGMVREFDEAHPIRRGPVFQPMPDHEPRRRVLAGLLVAASIASLIVLGVVRFEAGRRPDAAIQPVTPSTQDAPEGGSELTRPSPLPQPLHDVRAVLLLHDRSWIEAVADGVVLESGQTFEPGERVVFHADRLLELRLGNAGAVELVVDGERVPTGGPGDVVSLELHLRDGEVMTRSV